MNFETDSYKSRSHKYKYKIGIDYMQRYALVENSYEQDLSFARNMLRDALKILDEYEFILAGIKVQEALDCLDRQTKVNT